MSNIPTIFIAIAITAAINNVKMAFANSGLRPSALANSKFTVPANSGLQIQISKIKTILPPIQTNRISVKFTERISPKSKPMRSILMNESKPKSTSPIAKTECDKRPNRASSGKFVFFCKNNKDNAMKHEIINTVKIKLKFNA